MYVCTINARLTVRSRSRVYIFFRRTIVLEYTLVLKWLAKFLDEYFMDKRSFIYYARKIFRKTKIKHTCAYHVARNVLRI